MHINDAAFFVVKKVTIYALLSRKQCAILTTNVYSQWKKKLKCQILDVVVNITKIYNPLNIHTYSRFIKKRFRDKDILFS